MPILEANGQRLHVSERGEGTEPLLLMQGLSGNHLHWGEPFLGELAGDFRAIAYDHRGTGASPECPGGYSVADLADDAAALLDVLELADVHVMGISMGGMVGQELALRHPARVRSLVLGCTSPGGPDAARTDPEVVACLRELFLSGRVEEAMRQLFHFNVSESFATEPANREPFRQAARELPVSLEAVLAQYQAFAGHDPGERLAAIGMPTLIVHGDGDRILPVANARLLARRIPHARLEIFKGVGHLFWWERPTESARLVRELAQAAPVAQ